MKKLVTLLLAAGMVLGSFAGAQAIDWKVKGQWQFEFGYTDGGSLMRNTAGRGGHRTDRYGAGYNASNTDNFTALQRVDLQIDAVASENLMGHLRLEIGTHQWGKEGTQGDRSWGGALNQRGVSIGVRRAFIDWYVPNTELKIRMGIQALAVPNSTFNTGVFDDDTAGIVATYKINDNVTVGAFWARPWNDNWTSGAVDGYRQTENPSLGMDNVDVFGLFVPLAFDGVKVTPWGMIAAIGPNFDRNVAGTPLAMGVRSTSGGYGRALNGLFPAAYQTHNRRAGNGGAAGLLGDKQYATAWWAGLSADITAADPFRFAFDGTYGEVSHVDTGYLNRHGWFISALAEYKLDWGVPGLYFWWGSGDDGNVKNGSERIPVMPNNNPDIMLSTFGFSGSPSVSGPYDGVFGTTSFAGTWGIGARIRDMSFLEDLKHTLRVNFFGGTNEPVMAKYILGKKNIDGAAGRRTGTIGDFNGAWGGGQGLYLTRMDYGLEINLDNVYKIYENLDMLVELGYIHLWLDQSRSVWGSSPAQNIRGVSVTDAVKAAVYFKYSF